MTTLEALVTQLTATHSIGVGRIHTHRELRSTRCPGERLQALVEDLRRRIGQGYAAQP